MNEEFVGTAYFSSHVISILFHGWASIDINNSKLFEREPISFSTSVGTAERPQPE